MPLFNSYELLLLHVFIYTVYYLYCFTILYFLLFYLNINISHLINLMKAPS